MKFILLVFAFTLISFNESRAIVQSNGKDLMVKLFGTQEEAVKSRSIDANRKKIMPNISMQQFQFNSSRVARGPKIKGISHNEVLTKHQCQLLMQVLKKNKKQQQQQHERPESFLQGVWGVPG